jgi:hypothetical protein
MESSRVEPFPNNWAYLKTELNWLDRLLMLAVARQRKETREIERIAQSKADRVTSHWWKGLVTLEGQPAYDSPAAKAELSSVRPVAKTNVLSAPLSYQQLLDARIQASHQRGILLGIPSLSRRLQLTTFEKNLVLMCLATEVNQRYARIYSYLQGVNPGEPERGLKSRIIVAEVHSSLPTVDLILRLLCRNDDEWQVARLHLTPETSPLLRYCLLEAPLQHQEPFLNRSLRLVDGLVNYLLAAAPDPQTLETLIHPQTLGVGGHRFLSVWSPLELEVTPEGAGIDQSCSEQSMGDRDSPVIALDSKLILPAALRETLHQMCVHLQFQPQVDQIWAGEPTLIERRQPGILVLLAGCPGTGKTTAAKAIAQALATPLFFVDLARIEFADYPNVLQDIQREQPRLLVVKSAHLWFGRTGLISPAQAGQFWQDRQSLAGITFLSVQHLSSVKIYWRTQLAQILELPFPDRKARQQLWQQAFPSPILQNTKIDWPRLAQQWRLTGGEIQAIAQAATVAAIAESPTAPRLKLHHIQQALRRKKYPQASTRQ